MADFPEEMPEEEPTPEIPGEGVADEGAPAPPPPPPVIKNGRIAVTQDEGETVETLPVDQLDAATEQGFRPATKGEYRAQQEGFAGTLRAGVEGAARGVSFGTFDPLAVAAARAMYGDEGAALARELLSEDRDVHGTATTIGEIGGSLLPLALGAPPAEAAGAAGETLLSRAAAAAPRLFAEGAAFGLGNQLTEDTLGNHELVAGKYLASGLEGGLFNLVLGSALHAAGGAIVNKLATRAAEGGEGVASKAVGGLRAMAEEQAAKGAMPASTLAAGELQKLGRTSEEQMVRMRQIGRTLLDEGITTPGASKAVQASRLAEKAESTGKELGAIRRSFDQSAIRPSAENVMKRIGVEVVAPLAEQAFSKPEIASLLPYIEGLEKKVGAQGERGFKSFEELYQLRRELDRKLDPKLWNKIPGTAPIAAEELGKIRGILESEYESAAERAAADLGENAATEYKVKKALFSDLKTAEKWAKKGAAKEVQHRTISLTDTIMAGAGIASGHGALAVGAAFGNKAMRTYGNQVAAYALDRVSRLEVLQRAAAAFDAKLAHATESFFGKRPPPPLKEAKRVAITPAERVALRNAARQPAVLAEHIGDAVAGHGFHDVAPNVSGAIALQGVRAAQWLSSKLPPEPPSIGASAMFGGNKPRKLGPRGEAELNRAAAALDQDQILDDLARRRLSREQIEAIKFINPPMFYAIRQSLRDYAQEHQPSLTKQQEVALSIVADMPVSTYTRGATIRGFQQAFAQGAPSDDPTRAGGESTGKPIGKGHSDAAESLASPTDLAEANGDL